MNKYSDFFLLPLIRFINRGCRFKYIFFAFKLIYYKIIYNKRLFLSSFSVSFEKMSRLYIDKNSKVKFGNFVYIKKGTDIEAYDGTTINIGSNFFINKNSSIISRAGIEIGDNCVFAAEVMIYDHNFKYDKKEVPFVKQGFNSKKIKIGNNVWLGARVFVGPGVTIGDNVIVGTGTIVKKDIPSNTVVYSKQDLILRDIY